MIVKYVNRLFSCNQHFQLLLSIAPRNAWKYFKVIWKSLGIVFCLSCGNPVMFYKAFVVASTLSRPWTLRRRWFWQLRLVNSTDSAWISVACRQVMISWCREAGLKTHQPPRLAIKITAGSNQHTAYRIPVIPKNLPNVVTVTFSLWCSSIVFV